MRKAALAVFLLALSPAAAHERPHGPHSAAPGAAAHVGPGPHSTASGTAAHVGPGPRSFGRDGAVLHPAQSHDPLDCYCRAQGQIFAPGATICLRTPQGARMAECRMVINVMSWGLTDQACPDS